MKRLMIIDCNGVAHAAKHSTAKLSWQGRRTGVLFGFMQSLIKLQENLRADNWVFAWDSPNGYLRGKEYPNYKAKRSVKTEEDKKLDAIAYPQFNLLRSSLLRDLGFSNVICIDGFESDDIMAGLLGTRVGAEYDCTIVTRDKDLYQCLSDRVRIFDPVKSKLYTVSDLRGEWGVEPEDWANALSIAGCDTDNVEGVAGVGIKTAIKYITGKLKPESKAAAAIELSGDIIQRNFGLVYLPHLRTPLIKIAANGGAPTVNRMLAVAVKNGMRSMTTMQFKSRWEEAFK